MSETNYVIFHSPAKRIDDFIRIKLGSKALSRVDYIKYLGVLADFTLTWKPHITELSKKPARTTGISFKIRDYVSHEALKLLYYSLFSSFISYAIVVYGLTHPTVLDCLYKLQKKVVRTISFKDKYAHSTPLFHKLKILKIHDIHSSQLFCLVYECRINKSVGPLSDFFVPFYSIYNHNTMKVLKGNNLQLVIKESCSTNVLKKKLHDYYLSFMIDVFYHYYYHYYNLSLLLFLIIMIIIIQYISLKTILLRILSCLLPKSKHIALYGVVGIIVIYSLSFSNKLFQ